MCNLLKRFCLYSLSPLDTTSIMSNYGMVNVVYPFYGDIVLINLCKYNE